MLLRFNKTSLIQKSNQNQRLINYFSDLGLGKYTQYVLIIILWIFLLLIVKTMKLPDSKN